jgi:hypothetical protein
VSAVRENDDAFWIRSKWFSFAAVSALRSYRNKRPRADNSVCEISLMISSFVSGHGHRGLLATGGAPQEVGCIACDRNARGGVRRSRTCSRKAAEVLQSARSKDADGPWTEKEGMI